MAWWDDGIGGAISYPCSDGSTQPAIAYGNTMYDVSGAKVVDSISLNANKPDNESYTLLLNTFSLGTQLYAEIFHVTDSISIRAGIIYDTAVTMHQRVSKIRFYLKKGDNKRYIDQGPTDLPPFRFFSSQPAVVPGDYTYSHYKWNFIQAALNNKQTNQQPQNAFPAAGQSGGLTNMIAVTKDGNSGLAFWVIGFTSIAGPFDGDHYVHFSCPAYKLVTLSTTYLDDPYWFDPTVDIPTTEEGEGGPGGGTGGGGNIPSLPISPTYPGTDIGFPSLPTGGDAFAFSRLKLYKPTSVQLGNALDILYSDSSESTVETILESIKKWIYKPEQYCISLMLSAVDAATTTAETVKYGKYDSEVAAAVVSSQWQVTDCGTIDVPLKYGSFVDFEPGAKTMLYLPYVGFRSINANEVIGGQIAIKYYTDMLTGASVCMVRISKPDCNNSILHTFDCNLSIQVPLTSENYNTMVSSFVSAGVAAVAAGIATGGAGAGLAAAAGSAVSAGGKALVGGMLNGGIQNLANPDLTQSGNLTANNGILCHPKPYICVMFPVPTQPQNYNLVKGRPSNIYMSVNRCKGFTTFKDLHVDIPAATAEERDMIKAAFQRGVYV